MIIFILAVSYDPFKYQIWKYATPIVYLKYMFYSNFYALYTCFNNILINN